MPPSDPSDDVVAEMLKADAKNSNLRYARIGLGELLPKRPTGEAPKPNLRFLRNVLKETEGHNAALRAANERSSRSQKDYREDKSSRRDERSHRSSRRRRSRTRSPSRSPDRRHRRRYRSRSRSRSRSPESSKRHRSHKSRHHRSRRSDSEERRSKRRHRSRTPEKYRRSTGPEKSSPPLRKQEKSKHSRRLEEDSDPLEDIIGPLPPRAESPVRKRGRGAFASSSAMDAHFAADYDPSMDVRPDSEDEDKGDNWEQKVEAFRDRQKWRQQGADRLREAGFTEDQIKKWEKSENGGEKGEEDVKWNKQGEGREWDRGKVIDEDGVFMQRPEWGRLKGT